MYNMYEEGALTLRVDLKGDSAVEFLALKKHLGLSNNTEVIRHLISDAFKEKLPDQTPEQPVAQEVPG